MTRRLEKLAKEIDEFEYDEIIHKAIESLKLKKEEIEVQIDSVISNYREKERCKTYPNYSIKYFFNGSYVFFKNKKLEIGFKEE